ncbi:reverse transcriptase [Cucumis melo var. makuwa]|uniref:Reverse transcriptase n=1 Tax=Cucumis melo var. makuwa TaxID=1194695 RepID=A0A5D3C0R5_CUCMM|nr:reverse transcriptase [Cucumis melo var. makuwa]
MDEEIKAIKKNDMWELSTLLNGKKAVGVKWVFKIKRNEKEEVERYKARLVAKGYSQRKGIDYDELFALIARLENIRLLIALVAQNNWKIFQMDVKSIFLNGYLEEEVYLEQPPGYSVKGQEDKVKQSEEGIFISQERYTREILEKFNMINSKPITPPIEIGTKLSKHEERDDVDPSYFKSLVGSLRYLTCTRPDILFNVGLVSRFMESPTTTHLKVAKRILCYLKGTLDYGLFYS